MHEMHIIKDLFADLTKAVKKEGAARVTKIYLRMGEFTEINAEILGFFLKEHSRGTALEGAAIDIEKSPDRELRLVSFDCE